MKTACELTGKSRATLYRRHAPARHAAGVPVPQRDRRPPRALAAGRARGSCWPCCDSQRFADKAPAEVWAILLDEGIYLGSVSTMYRVLREAGAGPGAARAGHPPGPRSSPS